ncbi:RNA polymerase sigma factor [Desulfovibrio sp. QI0434]
MAHLPKSIPKEIFRKCYQHLKTFLQKKLPQNDVEDVIQTAFYKLVKADQLLLPQDEMLAWLYHVARNASIDLLKKKKQFLRETAAHKIRRNFLATHWNFCC